MRWSELITGIRDRLQETTEAFFETDRLMELARRAQGDIATETRCCEGAATMATVAGTREYALPSDCLYVEAATCGGRLLGRGDFRAAQSAPETSGTPTRFYVRGGAIGVDPKPSGAETLKLWYVRRPPLGAFTLYHDGGAGATAATATVADGTLTLSITGGTNAGNNTFSLTGANYDTVTELAAAINALAKGFAAMVTDTCKGAEPSVNLEAAPAVSCYKKTVLMDLAVEAPAEWQWLIEVGVLYRALWKDSEYGAGEFYRREYEAGLERMRRLIGRRLAMSGATALRDRYSASANGGDGLLKVIIP